MICESLNASVPMRFDTTTGTRLAPAWPYRQVHEQSSRTACWSDGLFGGPSVGTGVHACMLWTALRLLRRCGWTPRVSTNKLTYGTGTSFNHAPDTAGRTPATPPHTHTQPLLPP